MQIVHINEALDYQRQELFKSLSKIDTRDASSNKFV